MSRLKELYKKQAVTNLQKNLNIKNILAVPKIENVIVNIGIGKLIKENPKLLDSLKKDIAEICGQAPVEKKAKKSISGFKVRQGEIVGLMTTLRGQRMYEFIDKLVNIVLPRIRDFRGLDPKSFDKKGNYNLGIREHIVFPEIKQEKVEKNYGLEISVATTAKNKEEGQALLIELGFPFKK